MRSKITILGHPIHPMLIAFPIALYTATLGALLALAATGDAFWARLAELANGLALIAAGVAAIPGLIDYLSVVPDHGPPRRTARIHAAANGLALALFALCYVVLATRGEEWVGRAIVLSALGLGVTVVAGFHGWALVQDHHIGLDNRRIALDDRSAAAHDHSAADMVATGHGQRIQPHEDVQPYSIPRPELDAERDEHVHPSGGR